jgi:tetratricopeptide (TPR) repeat protein
MLRSASLLGFTFLCGLSLAGAPALAGSGAGTSSSGSTPTHHAAPPLSKAQIVAAKTFFERGQQLYSDGKYEAAWIEFSSAYEIAPLPDLIFNLARCEVKMGRTKEAIAHYREFLAAVPNDPAAPRIRTEIENLERRQQGVPEPTVAPPPDPVAATPAPPVSSGRKFPLASALLGGGTALFVLFGGIAVGVASSRYSTLSEPMPVGCKPTCTDEEVSSVRTPLNAGYAMFGLAAVAAAATAVVLPLELGLFNREKKVALFMGPHSLGIAGRF